MEIKKNEIFMGFLLGLLFFGPAVWLQRPEVKAENPSPDRYRRGQVTFADDQLQVLTGSVGGGATVTLQINVEQNNFVFAPTSADAELSFSTNSGGPIEGGAPLSVKNGESFTLAYERARYTYVNIHFPGAGGDYRLIITGRSDNLPGSRGVSQ